jgi:hypothetical protein
MSKTSATARTIYVDEATHAKLRRLAFERSINIGEVIAELLDPRTPDQIAQDEHAAEVLDTPEVIA